MKRINGYNSFILQIGDGDETDIRFRDPKGGYIVALTAKGQARKMGLGFVRDATGNFKNNSIAIKLAA